MTQIEWTHIPCYKPEVWNPVTGCTRVSSGCDNCYAVGMTRRLAGMPKMADKYSGLVNPGKKHFNGTVKCHEGVLSVPIGWKEPRAVFVNSMSDLFHESVPDDFIRDVFTVMGAFPEHIFMILTKRPDRMADVVNRLTAPSFEMKTRIAINSMCMRHDGKKVEAQWPLPNVWLGASVEDQQTANERIPYLIRIQATVRFLSCEPLLSYIDLAKACQTSVITKGFSYLPSQELHWVIAGGESGRNARPMHPGWMRSLRDQCQEAGVPFFFKQWGEWLPSDQYAPASDSKERPWSVPYATMDIGGYDWVTKKAAGRLLDGVEHSEFPSILSQQS